MKTPLQKSIEAAGGLTELANRLGVRRQNVVNWRNRGVPAEWCVPIESAVGGAVTRYDLRPDIFGHGGVPPSGAGPREPSPSRRSEASPKQGDETSATGVPVQQVGEAA